MAVFGDMHIAMRIISLFGCFLQIFTDGISEFQVSQLVEQVVELHAPTGLYTLHFLRLYLWRDLVSLGLCFLVFLYMSYLAGLLGWGLRPYIPYKVIDGGELDRCQVMRKQRDVRKLGLCSKEKVNDDDEEGLRGAGENDRGMMASLVDQTETEAVEGLSASRKVRDRAERHRNKSINASAVERMQKEFGEGFEAQFHPSSTASKLKS